MEKKKKIPKKKENKLDALEDTQVYGAGHEADEALSTDDEDDIAGITNGGIPDDIDEEDDDDDDDDNRA